MDNVAVRLPLPARPLSLVVAPARRTADPYASICPQAPRDALRFHGRRHPRLSGLGSKSRRTVSASLATYAGRFSRRRPVSARDLGSLGSGRRPVWAERFLSPCRAVHLVDPGRGLSSPGCFASQTPASCRDFGHDPRHVELISRRSLAQPRFDRGLRHALCLAGPDLRASCRPQSSTARLGCRRLAALAGSPGCQEYFRRHHSSRWCFYAWREAVWAGATAFGNMAMARGNVRPAAVAAPGSFHRHQAESEVLFSTRQ